MSNADIFVLLVAFQIKHFLADYPLQGRYMLGKFKGGRDWVLPLASHAAVNGILTWFICITVLFETPGGFVTAAALTLFDFTVHFLQDRLKASPHLFGRFKPDNKYFWWALGQDQMTHHLTHYAIIWWLLGEVG